MALYDDLGGQQAVSLALDTFYPKVLAHPTLSPFFAGVDMARLKERAAPFVTMALGGPDEYNGPGLRAIHRHLIPRGLDDETFEAFVGLFIDVLKELTVPEDNVSAIHAILNGARDEVLNR